MKKIKEFIFYLNDDDDFEIINQTREWFLEIFFKILGLVVELRFEKIIY